MSDVMRILIADDDPISRSVLSENLEEWGYQAVAAGNGGEAWTILTREDAPRLAILDWMMPGISGTDLCRRVRRQLSDRLFYLILLTARGLSPDIIDGFKAGADDYLIKPYNALELRSRLDVGRRVVELESRLQSRAESAESSYKHLFHNMVDGIFSRTVEGRFLDVNPAMARLLGYVSPEEMVAKVENFADQHIIDQVTWSDYQRLLQEKGEIQGVEYEIRRINGERAWLREHTRLACHNEDSSGYCEGMVQDVTQRRQAEEKIRRQAALLDAAGDAIFALNLKNKIVYCNQAARRLFGCEPGSAIEELFDEPSIKTLQETNKIIAEKQTWTVELKYTHKDGRTRIFESRWTLLQDDRGEPHSILLINTDITEKKELEKKLLRTQRTECIGKLAGGIAHDLNNILSPILMCTQILGTKVSDAKSNRMFSIINSSVQRGCGLVNQIYTFTRGSEGERKILEMNSVIGDVVNMFSHTMPKSVDLRINVSDDLWSVNGDPTQLYQVVLNLCINARDAIAEHGVIEISADNATIDLNNASLKSHVKEGRYVVISIRDTGAGIPESALNRIFQPYFTTKNEGKGTGLGLATTMSIVTSHKGYIDVKSKVGSGTTFRVYLPAAGYCAEKDETGIQDQITPWGSGETIIVVDDENLVCKIIGDTLEDRGFNVIIANNGAEALAKYVQSKEDIPVIITDLEMPDVDGRLLIQAVHSLNNDTAIIVITGGGPEIKLPGNIRQQVSAIISKPFTVNQLLETINDVLNRRRTN